MPEDLERRVYVKKLYKAVIICDLKLVYTKRKEKSRPELLWFPKREVNNRIFISHRQINRKKSTNIAKSKSGNYL